MTSATPFVRRLGRRSRALDAQLVRVYERGLDAGRRDSPLKLYNAARRTGYLALARSDRLPVLWGWPAALRLVGRGDTVVDVGANVGMATYDASRIVGAAGHVHAVEPSTWARRALSARMAGRRNVTIHAVAASDRDGVVPFFEYDDVRGGRNSLEPVPGARSERRTDTPARRLDDLLPADAQPALLKLDVEGHEVAVLRGASSIISRSRPILCIEVYDDRLRACGESGLTLQAQLSALGYVSYALAETKVRAVTINEVDQDRFDVICLPGEGGEAALRRLRSGRTVAGW